MKLTQMKVQEFIDVLASEAPAPGGGSASALVGGEGAALFMMVANLTIGKPKYAEWEGVCGDALQKGGALLDALTKKIDEDTEAFNQIMAAYKLPKETDEEKKARSTRIAEATLAATQIPFELMKLALDALKVTQSLVGKSNPNAASDLGVAAECLLTCLKGAWLNVKINLGGVKEAGKAEEFQSEGSRMMAEAAELAGRIYDEVLGAL